MDGEETSVAEAVVSAGTGENAEHTGTKNTVTKQDSFTHSKDTSQGEQTSENNEITAAGDGIAAVESKAAGWATDIADAIIATTEAGDAGSGPVPPVTESSSTAMDSTPTVTDSDAAMSDHSEKESSPAHGEDTVGSKPASPITDSKPATPNADSKPPTPNADSNPSTPNADSKPTTPNIDSKPATPRSEDQSETAEVKSNDDSVQSEEKKLTAESPSVEENAKSSEESASSEKRSTASEEKPLGSEESGSGEETVKSSEESASIEVKEKTVDCDSAEEMTNSNEENAKLSEETPSLEEKPNSTDKTESGGVQVKDDDVCVIEDKVETNKESTLNGTKATPSVSKQPHPCLVCKKVVKCKYNIVGNGDIRHLCDDACFKAFRSNPTQFLRSDGKVKATQHTKSNSEWTPKPQLCAFCAKVFKTDQQSKFEVKGGEIKPFCCANCLADYKIGRKICGFCQTNVKGIKTSLLASVLDGTYFAEFCSKTCHMKFSEKNDETGVTVIGESAGTNSRQRRGTRGSTSSPDSPVVITPTPSPPLGKKTSAFNKAKPGIVVRGTERHAPCSVCGQNAAIKHDVSFEGKVHKLCSEACFGAFRYANKLGTNECCFCGSHCFTEGSNPHTIQFEGVTKRFCTITCVNAFKVGKTKIVPCSWCSTKKTNFDMIERVDANNTYQLFCSLNCLSLYRVNLQATSNQSVPCDQCRKMSPAQYHLTMSDASVRNFCDYGCVMAFQAQFSKPQNSALQPAAPNERPTPMAQSKNTAANTTPIRQSTRQIKKVMQQPSTTPGAGHIPIISNVMSLAGSTPSLQGVGRRSSLPNNSEGLSTGTSVGSQIIIQPPPPKSMRNKALLCKPFTQTKATSCRPHTRTIETQTDETMMDQKKPVLIPVPVPLYIPTPMAMYSAPQPYILPIPVPIPVPMFIPTTKKSADSILKHIKEIQERMPADPFEAEILMMAEAVAHAEKSSSSDDSDNDDNTAPDPPFDASLSSLTADGGDDGGAEDMLSMALRMAEMRGAESAVLDLEESIVTTPVPHQPPPSRVPEPEFSTIDQDNDLGLSATPGGGPRGGWRGGKRRRGRPSTSAPNNMRAKRPRTDEPPPPPTPATEAEIVPAPTVPPILDDANMVLKYSFGVNAWKHWVAGKNEQLEKVSSTRSGKLKLFKTDLLSCTSDELNFSLCMFVKEVRKPNGDEYAPDSIYYLCLGIQQYLFENSRIDNIFTDFYYEKFTESLNAILQHYEVLLNTQGMIVCRIEEEHLWESKQLGAHSPHVLLNTLIYFNTRYFMLRTPEQHVNLSFSHIMKHWKKTNIPGTRTPGRSVYLRYYAPQPNNKESPAKAAARKREEVPVYEQGEDVNNPLRCPVKLYEFYLSKCPEGIRNRTDVFYLVPERSCVPDSPVWYSTGQLGVEPMAKMLNRVRVVREIQERHLHQQY